MPYIVRPRRVLNVIASLTGAAIVAGVAPAVAAASCVKGPESQPFAAYGDNASYVMTPGGAFEGGAPGWKTSKASVVSDNEGHNLTGNSHSLAIEPNGSAVSPLVCVNDEYPSFRFFARRLSGPSNATLQASVRWVNLLGVTVNTASGTLTASGQWQPSQIMKTDESLPLVGGVAGSSTLEVSLVFQATGGTFAIDDVYLDPYRR